MMIQLNPALPINTPKGEGIAHVLIDYGIEDNLYWDVFINETGECWTFSNKEIRACKNITLGRLTKNDGASGPKISDLPITIGDLKPVPFPDCGGGNIKLPYNSGPTAKF